MKKKKIKYKIKYNQIIFTFYQENHTLGNVLRYFINGNPMVDFVGYNVPHPSEKIMNLKISSVYTFEYLNIIIMALKNCAELGILIGNMFNKKREDIIRF